MRKVQLEDAEAAYGRAFDCADGTNRIKSHIKLSEVRRLQNARARASQPSTDTPPPASSRAQRAAPTNRPMWEPSHETVSYTANNRLSRGYRRSRSTSSTPVEPVRLPSSKSRHFRWPREQDLECLE